MTDRLVAACRFEDCLPLIECSSKARLPQNPQTVIVTLFPFYIGDYPERNVARFAVVDDYHKVAGKILDEAVSDFEREYPYDEFVAFVDDSPIREVHAAYTAGLGVIGNNGLLINEKYGSNVFVGTIVTSLNINPKPHLVKSCLNCGKCIEACPTNALSVDKPLTRELCRSFITQKRGELTAFERGEVKQGGKIWGCDICTDVCPMNQNPIQTDLGGFYRNILPVLTRENIDEAMANKSYNWRGPEIILRNLEIIEGQE